jgi:hypothetical protein
MIGYSNSSYRIDIYVPVGYSFLSLTPTNATNSMTTIYSVKLQQSSSWDTNSYLIIQLPSSITSNNSIVCNDVNTNATVACTSITNSTSNFINISIPTAGNKM